jgi:hypothetical protein
VRTARDYLELHRWEAFARDDMIDTLRSYGIFFRVPNRT